MDFFLGVQLHFTIDQKKKFQVEPHCYLKRFLKIEISFIREIAKAAKPVNGQNERRISCAAVDSPARLCRWAIKEGKP